MGDAKTPSSFVFIDQSQDATAKVTGAKRKAIRKQAMRDVGLARREAGGYGKINRRQLPMFVGSVGNLNEVQMHLDLTPDSRANNQIREKVHPKAKEVLLDAVWRLPPTLPRQGRERMRMEYNFDLLALSPLTTVQFSRVVATALANNPQRLWQLMQQPVLSSFLSHIPARWCSSPLLQKTMKWAMAESQRVFTPEAAIKEEKILLLLNEVLHELQSAVSDKKRRFASETLCASQLLAMVMMLEKDKPRDWEPFAIGAGKILFFRGPNAYESDFEKAMLISYLGFMFIETLSNNKCCFLEEPSWAEALKKMAVLEPPNSERHENIIDLWLIVFPLSRLFRDVTDYIMADDFAKPESIFNIVLECYELRAKHSEWRARYLAFSQMHNAYDGVGFKAREFCAISFSSTLLVDRLILALEPFSPGAKQLEEEVQEMANMIDLMFEESKTLKDWQCDVLMTKKIIFGQAAKDTEDNWRQVINGDAGCLSKKGTVSKEIFAEWNRKIGRERVATGHYFATDMTGI